MTLSSLSIYVIFVDPHQGNKDIMPFSLPTTKAYVECDRTAQFIQDQVQLSPLTRCHTHTFTYINPVVR